MVPAHLRPGAHGELLLAGGSQCLFQPASADRPGRPRDRNGRPSFIVVDLPDDEGSFSVTDFLPCSPINDSGLWYIASAAANGPHPDRRDPRLDPRHERGSPHGCRRAIGCYVVVPTNRGLEGCLVLCPGTQSHWCVRPRQWEGGNGLFELNCTVSHALSGSVGDLRHADSRARRCAAGRAETTLGWWLNTGNGPTMGVPSSRDRIARSLDAQCGESRGIAQPPG